MNLVSWNSAIQIRKREPLSTNCRELLWAQTIRPATHEDLVGNAAAIRTIDGWFEAASENHKRSACLFVHGESGTGKSTTIDMIAKKFGFEPVTTYASQSRTPARLEGVVREAGVHGSRGVVVLDDFEIFLSETTSLRVLSKLLRRLLSEGSNKSRCLFIIISNSKHRLFGAVQDVSTIVHFERLGQREMNQIFTRLAVRVRHHSYVPPMSAYLSSISTSGTITQGVQQLQLLYSGHKTTETTHRTKRKKLCAGSTENNRDCISYLWSDMYTDKILQHLMSDKFDRGRVIDRLGEFERGRLDVVGSQLHDEYARRVASMGQLRDVAELLSMSDTNRTEVHADALYDGENRHSWSASDISYVSFVACGIVAVKGQQRKDRSWSRKPHTRLLKCHALTL